MRETLTVPEYVTGYPGVAFGGYVAGLLAARSDAKEVRVDFRGRVPVGEPVSITQVSGGGAELRHSAGDPLVTARPAALAMDAPAVPSWEQAQLASEEYLAHVRAFPPSIPDCFGCSPVPVGEGIRLFPSRVRERRDVLAAAWVPDRELADARGELPPEIVWSALDCPGGWAGMRLAKSGVGVVTAVLTGAQLRAVRAGERYVSYAWLLGTVGRKITVGVGLAIAEGELCALAEALWVVPRTSTSPPPAPLSHTA
ncbi:hypothetical protein [Streptomyces sp. NPDC002851]